MNKLNTILVGADFSDCSRSALKQAVRLAKWTTPVSTPSIAWSI